jgi:transcriptional regulator with XRE-family HTH domain
MQHNPYGEKIRKVRDLRGYSQEYMAEQLGMSSQKQYGRYETGETKLDMDHLEAIAKVLDMSVPELLSFDEKVFFNQCTQQHVFGSHNTYHEASGKERELLMERVRHLESEVEYLRKQLEQALMKS